MKRLAALALLLAASGCAARATAPLPNVADAERTRLTLEQRGVPALAPQAFAEADQALRAAKDAERAGDALAAELHAERAVAAYQHAVVLARLARAADEEISATEDLGRATEQSERYAAARKAAERETADLENQLRIAREATSPAPSRPADPARESARLVAARSLATQARLLCSAAHLVSSDAPGLAEAEAEATELEQRLERSPRPAPIDAAARARAACLSALTKARRAGGARADTADALLGELSRAAAPSARGPLDQAPSRDERGVVVTLRALFLQGGALSPEGEAALKELGRVAAAHPGFGIQVVLHDDAPKPAAELARAKERGEAITKALVDAGASASKTRLEHAGARAPVFDPADPKRRAGNARVEIVFVTGG